MRVNIQLFGTPDFSKMHTNGLQKTINSLNKRIEEHREKMAHPEMIYPEWGTLSDRRRQTEMAHWQFEIETFTAQRDAAVAELRRRR